MLPIVLLGAMASASEIVIDDFEDPATFDRWKMDPHSTTGKPTRIAGPTGAFARINECTITGRRNSYASAEIPWQIDEVADVAIAFRCRASPGIGISLVVTDSKDEDFVYLLHRPLWADDESTWFRHVVPLTTSWWANPPRHEIQAPVTYIAISAVGVFDRRVEGSIDFDDVALVTGHEVRLDPFGQPLVPAPAGGGDPVSSLGVTIPYDTDLSRMERDIETARSAGFSWARIGVRGCFAEVGRPAAWAAFDRLLDALEERRMRTLFMLFCPQPLDCSGIPPDEPCIPPRTEGEVREFGEFAAQAAAHFSGRNVEYEIWNEPNLDKCWPKLADAGQYAAVLKEAILRIHEVDPAAPVITGGLSDSGQFELFAKDFLKSGAAAGADGIGFHPYEDQGTPESLSDLLLLFGSAVAGSGMETVPICNTEQGYTWRWFCSDRFLHGPGVLQAASAARALLCSMAVGFPRAIYYTIRDDGYGLVTADDQERPAFHAVRTLISRCRGRVLAGHVPTGSSHVVALRFDGASDVVVAAWACGVDEQVISPVTVVPPLIGAVDSVGSPIDLVPAGDRLSLTLTSFGGPVYLTFPKPGFGPFRRGDCNSDSGINISDPVFNLNYQFALGPAPTCIKTADVNDDGLLNLADPIFQLNYLFVSGPTPPPPLSECGVDPTADDLGCVSYGPCHQ